MTEDAADHDVDPEALREDIDAIKDAMGIEERYPGQARMWLVYGAAVAGATVATNVLFVLDLPPAGYVGLWFAMIVVVVLAQWRLVSTTAREATPDVDWRQLFGAMILAYLGLTWATGDLIAANTTGALRGTHFFSLVVLLLGLTFLVVGVVLGAEHIALRDRLPFYVGGLWMLVLAANLPHVPSLRLSGWAVFGVLFAVHSVGAYLLTRAD